MNIYLGPGGSPKASTLEGIEYVHSLGLKALEVEFVYGVKMTNKTADEVGKKAKEEGIKLSVHAPYYVNLSSLEVAKRTASKKRILMSAERAHHMGAEFVVFHPGYYSGQDPKEVYEVIKEAIKDMLITVKEKGWNVKLAPEIGGKKSAFGSLKELVELVKDTKCSMCIDFAHILARQGGEIDYDETIKEMKTTKLEHFHCHFSGIEYTDKGEKRHIMTDPKRIKELTSAIIKNKINCTIINESPDPVGDSLKMKQEFKTS